MTITKLTPADRFIYKVCDSGLWENAKQTGKFIGAEIDLQDGYIHFSTASQLCDTLARHFASRDGLVLLKIETSQLDIIWETARNGDLFPHLYDHLPVTSVVAEHRLDLSTDGYHILPAACLCRS